MRSCRCMSQLLFRDTIHTDHPNSRCRFSDPSNKNVTKLCQLQEAKLSWATVCVPDHNLLEGLDHPLKTWQSSSPFAATRGWSSSWKTLVKESGVLWTLKREQGRVSVFQSKEKPLNMKTRDHLQRWVFTYLNSLLSDFTHKQLQSCIHIQNKKMMWGAHRTTHGRPKKRCLPTRTFSMQYVKGEATFPTVWQGSRNSQVEVHGTQSLKSQSSANWCTYIDLLPNGEDPRTNQSCNMCTHISYWSLGTCTFGQCTLQMHVEAHESTTFEMVADNTKETHILGLLYRGPKLIEYIPTENLLPEGICICPFFQTKQWFL